MRQIDMPDADRMLLHCNFHSASVLHRQQIPFLLTSMGVSSRIITSKTGWETQTETVKGASQVPSHRA
jgi:hypothetical protein